MSRVREARARRPRAAAPWSRLRSGARTKAFGSSSSRSRRRGSAPGENTPGPKRARDRAPPIAERGERADRLDRAQHRVVVVGHVQRAHMKFSALFPVIVDAVAAAYEAQSIARPRIIVAISVDEFSADLFPEYRPLFKAGLHRLQTGVVLPAGYQSHAATETCPGHSTILTGSRPARTGIIANEWYDQSLGRADKKVYCSEDPSLPGSSSTNFTVSAQFLNAPTLGDRMKSANPGSRVVSVAGKDRAAIMMGGHAMDQVWFWSGKSFVTLKGMDQPTPAIVDKVNAAVAVGIMKPDLPVLPEPCRVRSVPVRVADKTVGVPRERKAGDFQGFHTSLAFDRATTDIAIGLIRELRLGAGKAPDVLSIGLSATDYVGHTFGTEGAEMCAQLLGVDENVGRSLAALDATD